jgi:hypothetical protein
MTDAVSGTLATHTMQFTACLLRLVQGCRENEWSFTGDSVTLLFRPPAA